MSVATARNLINLHSVDKHYASRSILTNITLGINSGDRIGIVGQNGGGKTTLLRLLAGVEEPDAGRVTQETGLDFVLVGQGDELPESSTIREVLVADREEHEWAGDPRFRDVLNGLLGGVDLKRFRDGLETVIGSLSGGERRRVSLARALIDDPELLLLDEPTNHLDIEVIDWLARYLIKRQGAVVVITHDRWFLDAVCTHTWEVSSEQVHKYEGGYAAYVLARAERQRQAAANEARRRNLLRKELAWLRRGPPARTAKPKFRIEAANDLIADEPPARNSVELMRFAANRLGGKVINALDLSFAYEKTPVLTGVTWRIGPGDRLALVGMNGTGKSTLIKLLSGELSPNTGRVEVGTTVRLAYLSQGLEEMDQSQRVLESLEEVREVAHTESGHELSATQLCERFGFTGGRAYTRIHELSGGERRRLQLMRLLMQEPNVLILDEPTNDLDIDTLTALEDLLDEWAGTLIIVSHDRYFIERVCDDVYALDGGGEIVHLPGGVEQYVTEYLRARSEASSTNRAAAKGTKGTDGAEHERERERERGREHYQTLRQKRKDVQRIEKIIARLEREETKLHERMSAASSDHEELAKLQTELSDVQSQREDAEEEWLAASEYIEEH